MIDAGDDSEYSSASETLNDDNYVPQTAAKIRHTISLNKEKVAPLATKYVKGFFHSSSPGNLRSALDGLFGSIRRSRRTLPSKTTKPVCKSSSRYVWVTCACCIRFSRVCSGRERSRVLGCVQQYSRWESAIVPMELNHPCAFQRLVDCPVELVTI